MYINAGMNKLPAGTMNITFAYLLSYNFICICLRCDKVVCSSDIAQNCMKISRLLYGCFIVPADRPFIPAFYLLIIILLWLLPTEYQKQNFRYRSYNFLL